MSVAAIVLAAGCGERLGDPLPKAFVPLAGVPIVVRALDAIAAVPEVEVIVPVIGADAGARFAALGLDRIGKLAEAVVGGAERQDSVSAGLTALTALAPGIELVAVHDAARCLIDPPAVSRVIAAARESGAALLATPSKDTIKRVQGGVVRETQARDECWQAQTPQVFRVELLREALDKAAAEGFLGTDDAQLVERLGVAVHVVEGDEGNLKITRPGDLVLAEAWLRRGEAAGR